MPRQTKCGGLVLVAAALLCCSRGEQTRKDSGEQADESGRWGGGGVKDQTWFVAVISRSRSQALLCCKSFRLVGKCVEVTTHKPQQFESVIQSLGTVN